MTNPEPLRVKGTAVQQSVFTPIPAANMTPLQRAAYTLNRNHKWLHSIKEAKNGLFGLSPETREAFDIFIRLAYKDTEVLRDQKDLYKEENKEAIEEVKRFNKANAYKTKALLEKERKDKTKDVPKFNCSKCYDKGITLPSSGPNGTPLFCICEKGISTLREYKDKHKIKCLICSDTGKETYTSGKRRSCACNGR